MCPHSIFFSVLNCPALPIFMAVPQFAAKLFQYPSWRPGAWYPSLKIAQGGIFQLVSTSYLFQHIKLPIPTNFHCDITICNEVIKISLLEAWNLVPQSKNSTRGQFSACVHILSFSAYQVAHLYQVSCWYHILHDYCNNLPH